MRFRWHLLGGALALGYLGLCLLDPEVLWFDPTEPVFSDAVQGESPRLEFYSRTIYGNPEIRFVAVVRSVGEVPPACTGEDGPFQYHAVEGPVVGKDLDWWTASSPECRDLPPGHYWVQTTWTIERPLAALLPDSLHLDGLLGFLVPAKHVTRDSPAFIIHPPESES